VRLAAGPRTAERRAELLREVVLLGAAWGTSIMLQRLAVAEVPPLPLVALRLLAAVVVFVPFAVRIGQTVAARPPLLFHFCLIGALNPVLSGLLTALALQRASSGLVAVMQTLSPIATAALAYVLLHEEAPRRQSMVGLAVAFGGVVLLLLTASSGGGAGLSSDAGGLLLAMGAPLAAALGSIYVRRHLRGTPPLVAAGGQLTAAFLLALVVSVIASQQPALAEISGRAWLAIVLSGAVGLSASFVLFVHMIGRHGPTAALLATYVMPVVATVLGVLVLGETITPSMLAGSALVLVGVVIFTQS
jgi:drug/metabolite transporter (DMT)-like permease